MTTTDTFTDEKQESQETQVKSLYDMTVGSPAKVLWRFSVPMLLSMMFQQLYNIVDSVVAGKFIGVDALAAVGASYPITILFIAVATGASIGCSVVVSQIFGRKNFKMLKSSISTAIISLTSLGFVLTVVGLVSSNFLMRMIHTPDNIFADSALYLRVYIMGLLFLFVYNTATAIYNGMGDSKTPLYFLIFSSLFNIVLDLIFVIQFHMGVAGVAWATFIAQGISSLLAMGCLIRRVAKIQVQEKYQYFDMDLLKLISRIAIPSILQQSFVSVGQLCVQGLINSYGSVVVAGYSAAYKINTFSITSINTMASSLSSFTAQNIGANKIQRVKQGHKSALLMTAAFSVSIITMIYLFGGKIIGFFVDASAGQEVVDVGVSFLKTATPFHLVVVAKAMADGVLRGAGDMKEFMVGTFADLLMRVVASFVLAGFIGYSGIWVAYPIGWVIGTAISVYYYYKGNWKQVLLEP